MAELIVQSGIGASHQDASRFHQEAKKLESWRTVRLHRRLMQLPQDFIPSRPCGASTCLQAVLIRTGIMRPWYPWCVTADDRFGSGMPAALANLLASAGR
jgi:hypothetical protein